MNYDPKSRAQAWINYYHSSDFIAVKASSPPEHHDLKSRAIMCIDYYRSSEFLEVRLNGGRVYEYYGVPGFRVDELLQASSPGRYFNKYIVHFPTSPAEFELAQERNGALADSVAEQSFQQIEKWLPNEAHTFVTDVLNDTTSFVVPVRARRTKHGDHRVRQGSELSEITVSVSGNPYQFLITLLHEIAHAQVYREHGTRVKPHGTEWKTAFSTLLTSALSAGCFPSDLYFEVQNYASVTPSSSSSDVELQLALRSHDGADNRHIVSELEEGQIFSLDGKAVLKKGPQMRKKFRCCSSDGRIYHVSGAARVHTLYK